MSTKRHLLGLGSTPPALFSVLLPFRWSSGEIFPAAIDVKALVCVQQFCWVPEGDVYGFLDVQDGGVACTVKDPCLLPERLVVSRPGVLCDC